MSRSARLTWALDEIDALGRASARDLARRAVNDAALVSDDERDRALLNWLTEDFRAVLQTRNASGRPMAKSVVVNGRREYTAERLFDADCYASAYYEHRRSAEHHLAECRVLAADAADKFPGQLALAIPEIAWRRPARKDTAA